MAQVDDSLDLDVALYAAGLATPAISAAVEAAARSDDELAAELLLMAGSIGRLAKGSPPPDHPDAMARSSMRKESFCFTMKVVR